MKAFLASSGSVKSGTRDMSFSSFIKKNKHHLGVFLKNIRKPHSLLMPYKPKP